MSENIKELQEKLTSLALKLASHYKFELNFSVESIEKVEDTLAKISDEYNKNKNDEGINGMALEFAAYIVTVIEKNIVVGKWQRDSEQMGKDTFPYDLGSGNYIFPYSWCLKRIIDGEGENVLLKFNTLVKKRIK